MNIHFSPPRIHGWTRKKTQITDVCKREIYGCKDYSYWSSIVFKEIMASLILEEQHSNDQTSIYFSRVPDGIHSLQWRCVSVNIWRLRSSQLSCLFISLSPVGKCAVLLSRYCILCNNLNHQRTLEILMTYWENDSRLSSAHLNSFYETSFAVYGSRSNLTASMNPDFAHCVRNNCKYTTTLPSYI